MKIGVILAILLFGLAMSPLASAENETVKLGDYTVSFDLGLPKDAYTLNVQAPQQVTSPSGDLATTYALTIVNKTDTNDFLLISLSKSGKEFPHIPTVNELSTSLSKAPESASNFQTATRAVDGTEGAMISYDQTVRGVTKKVHALAYLPKADERYLVLMIAGTIPSSNAIQLFDTIHVEKQK